jgi:hypothetical protein
MTVFVVTLRAIAGPNNSTPDGRPYDILAFVRAETEVEAETVALAGLSVGGWIEAYVQRTGEITDPDATPEDLRPAMERAERDGCALIVYEAA